MDGNKDESERCIGIAEKFINEGQREKAVKYLNKAERLYPSTRAKDLLDLLNKLNGTTTTTATTNTSKSSPKENGDISNAQRRNSAGGSDKSNTVNAVKDEYTEEQLEAVKQIKKCKDYYEILGVSKEAVENDLKKQYRKLALQFHPDKNKAPGAGEAFKAIGNAFMVLSDPEKRRRYDLCGPEEEQRARSAARRNSYNYEYEHSRGFEADMTAEELFNMFFGGSFNSGNVYVRRGNQWARYRSSTNHHTDNRDTNYSAILQLLPILLLIALSLTSNFFMSDPPYSLQKTQKYSVAQQTQKLRIPYYVKDTFSKDYKNSIRRVEEQVEDDYLNSLRTACFREMNYKETLLWRARSYGDNDLLQKANSLKTPSCENLRNINK